MQAKANMNVIFSTTSFEKEKVYKYFVKEDDNYCVKDIRGEEQVLSPVEFNLFFTKI